MQEKTNYSVLLSTSCICTYKKKLLKIKLTVNCAASFMQLSLNCFIMLDIFSNLWISRCSALCAWAMIRTVKKIIFFNICINILHNYHYIYVFSGRYVHVDFSKRRTSLASMMSANSPRLLSTWATFGISIYTILLQA